VTEAFKAHPHCM